MHLALFNHNCVNIPYYFIQSIIKNRLVMYENRYRNNTPLFIVGLGEGLVAPIVELLISGLVTAINAISSATGIPSFTWFIALFLLIDLARNILGCLWHTQYAIGHIIGSIFGIILCYGTVSLVNKEIANSSLLTTAILTISLAIGVVIAFLRWKNNRRASDFGY